MLPTLTRRSRWTWDAHMARPGGILAVGGHDAARVRAVRIKTEPSTRSGTEARRSYRPVTRVERRSTGRSARRIRRLWKGLHTQFLPDRVHEVVSGNNPSLETT